MEQLCSSFEFTHSCQVIGDHDQVLQVVLKRNEGVVFHRSSLFYCSSSELEETLYHEVNSLLHSIEESNENKNTPSKVKDDNLIRLRNVQNNFEYLGISKGGKIMKIIPSMYNELLIRQDCLLAFSDTVDLLEDNETKKRIDLVRKVDFFMQNRENVTYYMLKARTKLFSDSVSFVDFSVIKDYLYLRNENPLIEKRLGKGEQIIIKSSSLVLFEKSVSMLGIFENGNKKVQYVKPSEYIIMEGPVNILTLKKEEAMKSAKNFRLQHLLCLLLVSFSIFAMDYISRGLLR